MRWQASAGITWCRPLAAISNATRTYRSNSRWLSAFPICSTRGSTSLSLGYDLPDSGLVSQRLGTAFSIACASPAYLEQHGVPTTPADLANHICLRLVTPGSIFDRWNFDGPDGAETFALPPARFQVNGAEAMAIAVREGMGVAVLPTYTAVRWLRNGDLVWVMPEYTSQPINIYALYSSRQYLDAKIRTWVDFMREALPATLSAEQTALRQFARI